MGESKNLSLASLGIITAGGIVIGSQLANALYPGIIDIPVIPAACASSAGGFILDKIFKENEYEKLFRMCGIVNKNDQVPITIKKQKNAISTTLVVHMPEGISQKHFEQKQEELEQCLNSKIEFGFNKNLVMKLIHMNLSTNYNYEYEECENPTEVFAGYTHEGKFYFDVDKATQTIIAGEPNSGKSSLLRSVILSLILNNNNVSLRLIDFQDAELGIFENCKKVLSYGKTPEDFNRLMDEMEEESERRLKLFASVRNQRFIQKLSVWNKYYPDRAMPYIICVIDEFSRIADYDDLLEKFRIRVAMDRKLGILYVASMQRPDVKIISGSIKGCMPTRVAFKVCSDVDSEVILNVKGAEKIKTKGRCIMKYQGEIKEVQCLYIEPDDVRSILKKHKAFKTREEIIQAKKYEMKRL
jgi:hypothetical protein